MRLSLFAEIFNMLLMTIILGVAVYLLVLIVKALKKYINSKEIREEKSIIQRSLGEELKAQRLRCKMTQEFVADALGVSRQAVSKWETGAVDPSTSNLLALAKLYGMSAEELLKSVAHSKDGGG
jgi:DNA-binding XRE family transcriptional regulator